MIKKSTVVGESNRFSPVFWYFAEALEFTYYQQMCEPTNVADDYFHANYIADPVLLDRNLTLMCKD